ncbi:hypothetical protein ACDQ55_15160 [Chitinophaga sp. 30R24]|uniref:hypothetical protein n=1 Tax=Chitinophaga sp. 30R24 TaxID=3248838 RepID=UPI003B8FCBA2
MKRSLFIVIIFLTTISISKSQTTSSKDNFIVKFNVGKGDFVDKQHLPKYVKEGSTISIAYDSVNTFLYGSYANFSDINHNYQDGLSTLQAGFSDISTAKSIEEKEVGAIQGLESCQVKGLKFRANLTIPDAKALIKNKRQILDKIGSEFSSIEINILNIKAIMNMDTIIKMAINNPQCDNIKAMNDAIFTPVKVYSINSIEDIVPVFNKKLTLLTKAIQNITRNISDLELLKSDLNADGKSEIDELADSLNKRVRNLNDAYSGANLSILQRNVAIFSVNAQTAISSSFKIPARVIATANGDYLQLSDSIKDKNGNFKVAILPNKIKTVGGTRIDFSIGVSLNIGGNGSDYSFQKNPDNVTSGPDTAKVVLREDGMNKRLQLSPVIFIHWYQTTKWAVQWTLSGGLSPNFSDLTNTKIYLGTSLGFPSSNDLTKRFVVNLGVSAGFADVLKSKYKDYSNYAQFSNVDASDLTQKSIRVGAFVALSYNLGGSGH